jgi:hypothetical protein
MEKMLPFLFLGKKDKKKTVDVILDIKRIKSKALQKILYCIFLYGGFATATKTHQKNFGFVLLTCSVSWKRYDECFFQ